MLTTEEMDLLCRVGPGTPMGELMRRYWLPVNYEWEAEPDGQPLRVRVLGEDLLAWRDTNGVPAFTQDLCPHRGASFYFGRNEECGLRCTYHGWKFDVDGNCTDMPNEPATSNFKNKLKITSYKGADFGGITWVYMGPDQDNVPGLPQFEWGLVPEEQRRHRWKFIYQCNWLQGLEGELDSTHLFFAHSRLNAEDSPRLGVYHPEHSAQFSVRKTDYGLVYGAQRPEADGSAYWRTSHFLFPIYGMFPATEMAVPLSIYLPIDDETTVHFGLQWHPSRALEGSRWPTQDTPEEGGFLMDGVGRLKPEQKGKFFANWWSELCPENDFLMNVEDKKYRNYTGIPSVRQQDAAQEWSMGPIMDRTKEHLGTADAAIIRARRMMIAAARALAEDGTLPPGSENPELYTVRSCSTKLRPDADWLESLSDWFYAKTFEYPDHGYDDKAPAGRL